MRAPRTPLRYVALGDSYTIGTSVEPAERFPDQLVRAVGARPSGALATLELVANLGVNGYTSADVIRDELPAVVELVPDVVSVLIGVNDVVQGVPLERYATNVETILDALLGLVPPARIIALTVPDYTVTPAGSDYGDPRQQHDAIVAVNATFTRSASARRIPVVDVFDISGEAAEDRRLVASDGLHPSGVQYARWVERIVAAMERSAIPGR